MENELKIRDTSKEPISRYTDALGRTYTQGCLLYSYGSRFYVLASEVVLNNNAAVLLVSQPRTPLRVEALHILEMSRSLIIDSDLFLQNKRQDSEGREKLKDYKAVMKIINDPASLQQALVNYKNFNR